MRISVKTLLLLTGLMLFFIRQSNAQLTITPAATAAALAAKLTGPGVLVLNPVLTCAGNAEGIFSGISSLSFDSGIVLTTGQAQTGATNGANGPATNFASLSNSGTGDPSLDALAGAPTFDACVLEFDFRPSGDTIKFNYVFGSEEYNGFTCSQFNDVFGFFISGPGYATPVNIALVPGTTIPVCINSVNCGPGTGIGTMATCTAMGPGSPFCTYYIDNTAGTTITYDGLTQTLTAIARVTPCDTFHLKIGIADGTDEIWDSGVFLQAQSLTSINYSVSPQSSNPSDTSYGGPFCIRNCAPGSFTFSLSAPATDTQVMHYVIGGTAINGVDYVHIADSVVIPPGSTSATTMITGLPTATPTGPRTVVLYLIGPFSCDGSGIIDSAIVTIFDSFMIHVLTPDTAICLGQSLVINTINNPFLTYQWNPSISLNNATIASPTATPTVSTTYTVTGTYTVLGCPPSAAEIAVRVTHLDVRLRDTLFCVGQLVPLSAEVIPLDSFYTYNWSPAAYLNNNTLSNPVFSTGVAGDYVISANVINAYGCGGTGTGTLHVMPLATVAVSPGTTTTIPLGEQVQLDAVNLTPYPLIYWWSPPDGSLSNPNINNPIAIPADSTTYVVHVMNQWGCQDSAAVTILVDNSSSEYVPTAFTPNGDGINDVFRIMNMHFQKLVLFEVYNRWGQVVYQNSNSNEHAKGWDGTFNGVPQEMGIYYYQIIVAKPGGEQKIYKGDVTLIR